MTHRRGLSVGLSVSRTANKLVDRPSSNLAGGKSLGRGTTDYISDSNIPTFRFCFFFRPRDALSKCFLTFI